MNRTLQAIVGVILILVIAFSAIVITQHYGTNMKVDVTDQKIFTLSDGTKSILGRLNQPITAKLFYGKTASTKGTDQIRFFNNYYNFVRALLEEYVEQSNGNFKLEIIDPRPYSPAEEEALKHGLRRFPITQEENFFFGLVIQTQFGVNKVIEFFAPDRQNFVEYDISYLIDTAITRQKKVVGVMSSLSIMGDTGYMAQMKRMQNQPVEQSWGIVEQLRQTFDVQEIAADINDVNSIGEVDILLVIHPKDLSEETQFAIDQYVLKGGRAIVCVDPFCFADRPPQQQPGRPQMADQNSSLDTLLGAWGLEMPSNTFAGDRRLALEASLRANQRASKIIGLLGLNKEAFNQDHVMTGQLNEVRMLFAGALKRTEDADPNAPKEVGLEYIPLVHTTSLGNTFKISGPYELTYGMDAASLMKKFVEGTSKVNMGYQINGTFKSAFPNGISIDVEQTDPNDPNETITVAQQKLGLTESSEKGSVVVFSDVDFMTDMLAFQNSIFGRMVVGDNSSLLVNAIESLAGSTDLISIRSRGNFRRPFVVIDEIEAQAEKETAQQVAELQAQINGYNQELQTLVSNSQENQAVIGSSILQKRRDIELQIRQAEGKLNDVKLNRRQRIEAVENRLHQINTLAVPAVILLIAIALGIHRGIRKRHYISHESD